MSDLIRETKLEGIYHYHFDALNATISAIIRDNLEPQSKTWLEKQVAGSNSAALNACFVMMPRKTGRSTIRITDQQSAALEQGRPGLSVYGWAVDRLCRVWTLMQYQSDDKQSYFRNIENLFLAAEMNELVALYSALPVLAYPEQWRRRCAEGIRSNIGDVLQAIMCRNPYPAEELPEAAWNQLVLKAFFTEKPVNDIIGLDRKANGELAKILSDYAHERWAAGRPVNPLLWRCVGPFVNETIFPDIRRLAQSELAVEREAAALCCASASYPPAKHLFESDNALRAAVEGGQITWESIAQKTEASAI